MAAFDLCIPLMDRGEKCELVSDAQYAYGELGRYIIFTLLLSPEVDSSNIFGRVCACLLAE